MQDINDVPVLIRREIEALITVPLIRAFIDQFGREPVLKITERVICSLARQTGEMVRAIAGSDRLDEFAKALSVVSQGGALEFEIVEASPDKLALNFTRCKYAEMYRKLGMEEFGFLLSCGRDAALAEGFNPNIKFSRTQTIMQGADHCDFTYEISKY